MEKRKSPRLSLVKSLLCTVLCLGLLVGTTFAWFSDEAKTGDTTITAGNLDVKLQIKQGEEFVDADDSTALFDDGVLWEPGMMWKSGVFKVVNAGNLALQYELTLEIAKGEGGADLSEVIQMKVVAASDLDGKEIATLEERRELWNSLGAEGGTDYSKGKLLPAGKDEVEGFKVGESDELAVVLFWNPSDSTDIDPERNPDNEYNVKDGAAALSAAFSLDVFATQVPYESDSFGKRYDNIYVAGNDRELLEAVEKAGEGDLINIKPGNYSGDDFLDIQPGVDIKGEVDPDTGSPLTIVDIKGNSADFTGSHISNVKFEKLESESEHPPLGSFGIVILRDGGLIENCEFFCDDTDYNTAELRIEGSATVRNCKFTSNARGIGNSGATGEILIENCAFKCGSYAIHLLDGDENGHITVRGCRINGGYGIVIGEKVRLGMTMEDTVLTSCAAEIYTAFWTSEGNTFEGNSNMFFEIANPDLVFTSTGDTFTCRRATEKSAGYLFSGRQASKAAITIDGNPPKEGWVQPAAQ